MDGNGAMPTMARPDTRPTDDEELAGEERAVLTTPLFPGLSLPLGELSAET